MLQITLTHVLVIRRNSVANLFKDASGNSDRARLSQGFYPGGDVDALTVNIVTVVDYITEVYTHSKGQRAAVQLVLH